MERMERGAYRKREEIDDEQKLRNFILADVSFYNKFKDEWNEITDKLKQICEASKLTKNNKWK